MKAFTPVTAVVAVLASIAAGAVGCGLAIPALVESKDSGTTDASGREDASADGTSSTDGGGHGDVVVGDAVVMCGDTSIDLATSPENCGKCGHSCLGGACESSACQPVALGTPSLPSYAPLRLTVSDPNVYVTVTTEALAELLSIPTSGGVATTLFSFAASGGMDVATDGTHVYVTFGTGVDVEDIADGAHGPFAVGDNAEALAVAGANVYWTVNASDGGVHTCPLDGCPDSGPVVVSAGRAGAKFLATDGTNLYWSDSLGIEQCEIGGTCSNPNLLTTPTTSSVNGLTAYGGRIFWTLYDGTVWTMPGTPDSGAPTMMWSGGGGIAIGMASDATGVYWCWYPYPGSHGGTISACPVTGCGSFAPRVVVTAQGEPVAVALDPVAVYWLDGAGTPLLLRVAK
jgi:hypothetical protein